MIGFAVKSVKNLETVIGDHRSTMRRSTLLALIATILLYTIPYTCGRLLDEMVTMGEKGEIDLDLILQACTIIFLVVVLWYVSITASGRISTKLALSSSKEIRNRMNSKMMTAPKSFLDSIPPGDFSSRFTNDLPAVTKLISSDYAGFVTHLTMLISINIMMLITSPMLACVYLLLIPVIIVLVNYLTKESEEDFETQKLMISDLNNQMNDIIASHKTIKSENLEAKVNEEFENTMNEFTDAYIASHSRTGMITPMIGSIVNVGYLIIVIAGVLMLLDGRLEMGMFMAFLLYVRMLTGPLISTSNIYNGIQDEFYSLNRILEILNAPVEEHNGTEEIDVEGKIEFENVCFGYTDREVLHDVSFTIEPNRITAIVGPTASGKTTIANLIMGMYRPTSGSIRIDGVDRENINIDILHRNISFVIQNPWQFDGTIRENIVYNRTWITEEDMLEVSRKIGLDNYVRRLPKGYDTSINEDNRRLPLSQRRMLAMCRALVGDPKIVVLDESVAGIDPITGQSIIDELKKVSGDRTIILVTHNRAVIAQADDVLYVNNGRVSKE